MGIDALKNNSMMKHLIDSLESGEDIGHYGRLVFTMVARYFLDEEQVIAWLQKDADCDEEKARALVEQVSSKDYNPPTRERVLEWMKRQDFEICDKPEDPRACNVYKDLQFPEELYKSLQQFHAVG